MKVSVNEFKSKDEINLLQENEVKKTIKYVYDKSRFYREKYDELGIKPEDIKTLDDIRKLPFTTKFDIQKRNEDFFCVPQEEIVEFVSTSGTTGEPVLFPLTKNDLDRLALNEALSFSCLNTLSTDSFQIMVNMGNMFVAGLAYYLGLIKLGATTYRIGSGLTKRQLYLLNKYRPNGIVSVPSFLIKLRGAGLEEGIDVRKLGIEKIVLIGETILETDLNLNPLGKKVQDYWGVRPYSTYGSTEMSTSFSECIAHEGLHSHPELIYIEVVDEEGNEVDDGMLGELVVTTLRCEGMPLVRYRTGDITFKISGQCSCGRNTDRIGPILGRKNQLIKSKGTTIYPAQIEKALIAFNEIVNYVIEVSTGDDFSDVIKIKLGVKEIEAGFIEKVKEYVNAIGRVTPEVELLSPEMVEKLMIVEGQRKPRVFIDLRNIPDFERGCI